MQHVFGTCWKRIVDNWLSKSFRILRNHEHTQVDCFQSFKEIVKVGMVAITSSPLRFNESHIIMQRNEIPHGLLKQENQSERPFLSHSLSTPIHHPFPSRRKNQLLPNYQSISPSSSNASRKISNVSYSSNVMKQPVGRSESS